MKTVQIFIDERTTEGKKFLARLKAHPSVASIEKIPTAALRKKSPDYRNLEKAFLEIREVLDGKDSTLTLEEFLSELEKPEPESDDTPIQD
jgi:hypothetical protein